MQGENLTGIWIDSYGTISFPAREYSPLLGRFLSADSIVPRPGDPQSLNRYSYTRNNPVSRIDKDGHADEDPLKDFLCKYNLAACLPETQLTPQGGGEVLNVNDGSVEVVPGPGGQVMAKGSGKGVGQKIKDAAVSAATKLCQGILAIICGGAGAKAAEETKKAVEKAKPSDFGLRKIVESASGMNLAEAGKYFGWKPEKVIKSATDFTRTDLISKGFTKEVLIKIAEAYEKIAASVSDKGLTNQSAPGRAEQLREIIEKVFGD